MSNYFPDMLYSWLCDRGQVRDFIFGSGFKVQGMTGDRDVSYWNLSRFGCNGDVTVMISLFILN